MFNYKNKVLEFIVTNCDRFDWQQDKSSNYTDFEAKLKSGITLRVVSNKEGVYLQILKSCTNYECYDAEQYRDVEKILDSIRAKMRQKKEDEFFESVYNKLIEEY